MSEAREIGYDEPGREGAYLKIDKGQTATVRFTGRPITFEEVFEDKDTGEKTVNEKFASVVILRSDKGDVAKGYKYPYQVYKQLRELNEKKSWGDPTTYDVDIKNNGAPPLYWQVTPAEKSPLTDADAALLAGAKIDFVKLFLRGQPVKQQDEEGRDPFQDE